MWWKGCFKIRHEEKIPIQKMTSCVELTKNLTYFETLDSKSDALLKTCSKIWFFSKVLIQKLFFFHFFSISWFLRKRILKEFGVLRGKRIEKWFSSSKSFIKIGFCTNQVHFKMWFVVRLFFFEIWHVLNFSIRQLSRGKKWL